MALTAPKTQHNMFAPGIAELTKRALNRTVCLLLPPFPGLCLPTLATVVHGSSAAPLAWPDPTLGISGPAGLHSQSSLSTSSSNVSSAAAAEAMQASMIVSALSSLSYLRKRPHPLRTLRYLQTILEPGPLLQSDRCYVSAESCV